MKLTSNQKEINANLEAEAKNCDQRAKEMLNRILNAKIEIEEAEKAGEQWMITAAAIRTLKYWEK